MEMLDNLGLQPVVVLINIGFFICVYLFMRKFLFQRVTVQLDARKREFDEGFGHINSTQSYVDELARDYAQKYSVLEKNAYKELQRIVKNANQSKADLLAQTYSSSDDYLKESRIAIVREKNSAITQMRTQIPELTGDVIKKLSNSEIDSSRIIPVTDMLIEKRLAK
ncbi:MAG: hypothetical protein HZA48_10390 [Planctomycetes bacterium]|nr:hypothetical protein [Planctomycetota bacterium]